MNQLMPLVAGLLALSLAACASQPHVAMPAVTGSPLVALSEFQAALRAGDGEAAMAVLDPEVLVYEMGGADSSAAEYAGHHLPHDMAFMAAISSENLERQVWRLGDNAIIAERNRMRGVYKGKAVDVTGAGSYWLRHNGERWRIAHIHWSSSRN